MYNNYFLGYFYVEILMALIINFLKNKHKVSLFKILNLKIYMIARVKVDGNYLETLDDKGRKIKREYCKADFLGNSNTIVVVQDGNYVEVFNEDLKKISRSFIKMDRFLGASGNTFSVQVGNYAETYDEKGKRISRNYSK